MKHCKVYYSNNLLLAASTFTAMTGQSAEQTTLIKPQTRGERFIHGNHSRVIFRILTKVNFFLNFKFLRIIPIFWHVYECTISQYFCWLSSF